MVETQLRQRGIVDERVLDAMLRVARHAFVAPSLEPFAYSDRPLPLEEEQTISQPYIVAYMCQALRFSGREKVLEIGTGSGYETAVLTLLAREVFSIEIRKKLYELAQKNLAPYAGGRLHLRLGNGLKGWPETAPFDRILLSASPPDIPQTLLDQLSPGGMLLAPVGNPGEQTLVLAERTPGGFKTTNLIRVAFVPARKMNLP